MIRWLTGIALAVGALVPAGGAIRAEALLRANGHFLKWKSPSNGSDTVISYAVLSGPFELPNDKTLSPDNCGSMHAFSDIVAKSPEVSVQLAKQELKAAFAAWEKAAALTFVEVEDASRANIVIGAAHSPAGRAFANLRVKSVESQTPVSRGLGKFDPEKALSLEKSGDDNESDFIAIEQAYVCLSPQSRWKVGLDGNIGIYDLRYTFTHEIGHAIGLDHPGRSGAVMAYRYEERVQQLTPSDVSAVQKLYGSRQ
ncbi:MAG: matrixin family metalloprotease [Hyphomicrobium sp.]|nr:matrixin family metalloprotease [Hyphomicrobium sp.]